MNADSESGEGFFKNELTESDANDPIGNASPDFPSAFICVHLRFQLHIHG
jgi:hypothetical protein